jgi:hypothetical protein
LLNYEITVSRRLLSPWSFMHLLWVAVSPLMMKTTAVQEAVPFPATPYIWTHPFLRLATKWSARPSNRLSQRPTATQGLVTLFRLGEVGLATVDNVAQLALGAGGGLMLDVFKHIHPRLKDLSKPTGIQTGPSSNRCLLPGSYFILEGDIDLIDSNKESSTE